MKKKKKQLPGVKTNQERTEDARNGFPLITTEDGRRIFGDGGQLDRLLPKQTYHSVWDSPEAFARYIASLPPRGGWTNAGWDEGEERWYGTNTMKEALELAEKGWKEGADRIEKLRAHIQAAHPLHPKLISYGLVGATPNVPRAVAGNLFNMRQPDPARSKKKPVITLVANMSANCGINPEKISNRAAVLAAVIDEVENAGYSCEVLATAMSKGNRGFMGMGEGDTSFKAATSIVVKPSHQPVDLMKLAFSLGHAALFRRLIFADWAAEPSCKSGLGHGLGNAGCGFEEEANELLEKGIYLLPSAETNSKYFKDEKTSMEVGLPYLIQFLKDKGCPPFKNAPEWKDPNQKETPDEPEYDEDDDD